MSDWDGMVLNKFIHETSIKVGGQRAAVIEEQIRLVLQPKPRWIPESVWKRVVARLLVIEYRVSP